jgi:hypothetical protein
MKRILPGLLAISLLSGCFVTRIFHKKEKYGCPTNGRNIGAEQLSSGDPKLIKLSNKAKYKGGKKV